MARATLPPTPLASGLVSALLVLTASRLGTNLTVRRENSAVLSVELGVEQKDFAHTMVTLLEELEPKEVSMELPLIPVKGPGADRKPLQDLLEASELRLSGKYRSRIYSRLVELIKRRQEELASAIQQLNILRTGKRGLLIAWGGEEFSVPNIVKSEAFYEIGRFGGLSDRKTKPDAGKVDYKASAPLSALLFALLLALQTGYEGRTYEKKNKVYMFTTVQLEPGKLSEMQAQLMSSLYQKLVEEVRKVGLSTWSQDYEGLRLASVLSVVEAFKELKLRLEVSLPENIALNHTIIATTGRRFFPLFTMSTSLSEVDTAVRALESFTEELQAGSVARVARVLRALTVASLRAMERSPRSSARELWSGVRMLLYAFLEGRKYEVLDNAYRLLRLLAGEGSELREEFTSSFVRTAEDLGIKEQLVEDLKPFAPGLEKAGRAELDAHLRLGALRALSRFVYLVAT